MCLCRCVCVCVWGGGGVWGHRVCARSCLSSGCLFRCVCGGDLREMGAQWVCLRGEVCVTTPASVCETGRHPCVRVRLVVCVACLLWRPGCHGCERWTVGRGVWCGLACVDDDRW